MVHAIIDNSLGLEFRGESQKLLYRGHGADALDCLFCCRWSRQREQGLIGRGAMIHLGVIRVSKRIDSLVKGLKGEDLMVCYLWMGEVVLPDLKGRRVRGKRGE
jgi:hypothetical protein